MAKRASLKGKGAEIFLGSEEERQEVRPARKPHQKATFYFPPELLEALDNVWLELRRVNRSVTKSELVAAALRSALDQHTKDPKSSPFSHFLPF